MAHLHSIYDSDLHFVIDPVTRVITNQSANKNSVIQFDHNSERFTFELPRYIEEHDMLGCNRVEVHYVNIDSKTGTQVSGVYEVQDLQVSPHDDKVAICSWLVSNNATQYAGTLNFVVRFACTSGDVVDYVWNTAVFKNYAVQNGLYNSDPIVTQYPDVLAQWYDSLFTASADGVTNILEARAAAITAVDAVADERIADIEKAGSDVIASLPPEYLEMVENMAPPIVETATGEAIAITDSADRKLRGLTLYGKSTQDGTPTPEAPVEIESVVEPTVRVCGKNLCRGHLPGAYNNTSGVYSTEFTGYRCSEKIPVEDGVIYTQSNSFGVTVATTHFWDKDGNWLGNSYPLSKRPTGTKYVAFNYLTQSDGWVQLESGETATSYEPYTEQTIPLTRTLPGIPVTSGGNYTDENGQQWVCDEVDFERGVYVQRVVVEICDGSDDEKWWVYNGTNHEGYAKDAVSMKNGVMQKGFCNCFPVHSMKDSTPGVWMGQGNNFIYLHNTKSIAADIDAWLVWLSTNPMTLVYPLATPVETALTAEELAAYASLRSNYPNTSVLNDGGAGMTVAYVADTKLYIDRKIKEVTV